MSSCGPRWRRTRRGVSAGAEELGRQIQQAQRTLGAPVGEMVVAGAGRDVIVDADAPTVPGGAAARRRAPTGRSRRRRLVEGAAFARSARPGAPPPDAGHPAGSTRPCSAAPWPAACSAGTGRSPAADPRRRVRFASRPSTRRGPSPAGRNHGALYGAIAAAVVVVLGIIGVVAFTGGDDATNPRSPRPPRSRTTPEDTPTDEPAPTPTAERRRRRSRRPNPRCPRPSHRHPRRVP